MTLSIALASYNGARYLRAQLDSLAAQTRRPDELVLSDDGSQDETLALVADFARTAPFPVLVLRNPARLGYAANFLAAARACHGDLIAFCDQDDVWAPQKLERCEAALRDPGVGLVIHGSLVIDAEGRPTGRPGNRIVHNRIQPAGRYEAGSEGAAGHAMVFRSELLRLLPAEPFALDVLHGHDDWTYFLAAATSAVAFLAEDLVQFRQHAGNATDGTSLRRLLPRLRRSWSVDAEELARQAATASRRARDSAALAQTLDARLQPACEALAEFYREQAAVLAARAEIGSRILSRPQRARLWWRRLVSGGYRPSPRLGISRTAAVRDAMRIALG